MVTGKRGKSEFVEVLRRIIEEWYPSEKCDEIALVMGNLNTHKAANLYEYLQPSRARGDIRYWQFTSGKAREKMKRHYPTIDEEYTPLDFPK